LPNLTIWTSEKGNGGIFHFVKVFRSLKVCSQVRRIWALFQLR
jgi:hypothetical protein